MINLSVCVLFPLRWWVKPVFCGICSSSCPSLALTPSQLLLLVGPMHPPDGGRRRPGAPGRVPDRTTLGRTGGRSPGTCGERASGGRSRMESASMLYQGSSQATRARPAQHRRGAPAHGPRTGETPPQTPPPANIMSMSTMFLSLFMR